MRKLRLSGQKGRPSGAPDRSVEVWKLVAAERPDVRHGRMAVDKRQLYTSGPVDKYDQYSVDFSTVSVKSGGFPHNPQDQQQQSGKTDSLRGSDEKSLYSCGNVQKVRSEQKIEDLALKNLCKTMWETVQNPKPLLGCRRQAFASIEVAETTAIGFAKLGIEAKVEQCSDCRMIHLKEIRK